MKFKIAILQKRSLDRKYERSTEIVIENMKEAAHNGADILLLPEAFLTGYVLPMKHALRAGMHFMCVIFTGSGLAL